MSGRCCVFQPFDKGAYDKRYEDTVAPAIEAADLEPYRVDRDDGAVIPIETLHDEIRGAALCLADITTQNANVMYELGYALASGKDIVLICAMQGAKKFPFDIQHRGIILYASESASDFERLKTDITNRIRSLLRKRATTQELVSASPVKSTHGLQPSEIAALALIMANVDSSTDRVPTHVIKRDMENAGYTRLATQLALTRLSRMQFIEAGEDSDFNGNMFVVYRILETGENWLLDNQQQLELRFTNIEPETTRRKRRPELGITDDDVPF